MRCVDCPYYKSGYMWNACELMQVDCISPQDDCDLVNPDGTINFGSDYFDGRVEDPD